MNNIKGISLVAIILWITAILFHFTDGAREPAYLGLRNILMLIHTLVCFVFIWFELKTPESVKQTEGFVYLSYHLSKPYSFSSTHLYLWLLGFSVSFWFSTCNPLSQEGALLLFILSIIYVSYLNFFLGRSMYLDRKFNLSKNREEGKHLYLFLCILFLNFQIIWSNMYQLRNFYGNEIEEPYGSNNIWRKHGYTYEDDVYVEKNGAGAKVVKALIYSSNYVTYKSGKNNNLITRSFSQNLFLKDILDESIPDLQYCGEFEKSSLGLLLFCSDADDNEYTIIYDTDSHLEWLLTELQSE